MEEHVIKVTGVSESRDVRYLLSAHICTCTQYSPTAVVARCDEDCIACGSRSVGSGGATKSKRGGGVVIGVIRPQENSRREEGGRTKKGARRGTGGRKRQRRYKQGHATEERRAGKKRS